MNPSGANPTKYVLPKGTHRSFITQMADWYSGGESPAAASQDLRYIMELQKQKLHSLGLEMQYKLPRNGSGSPHETGVYYCDRIYATSAISGDMITRSVVSAQDQRCLNVSDVTVITLIIEPKEGMQPDAGMAMNCPHCGAPSKLGELQAGCQHCGTHFLMSELYPKVMNYYAYEKNNTERNRRKNKRDLRLLIAVCSVLMLIYIVGSKLYFHQGSLDPMDLINAVLGGITGGFMFGFLIYGFKKLFEIFGLMGRGLRGGGHTISTLMNDNKIKKHDPEFSSEYFRDKVISLFRMAVYSKEAAELACCKCRCPKSAEDIIEAQLFNFNINNCQITDGVCDADLTLFLDCLHYRKKKVIVQTDKYRMHVRKKLKAVTDLGFSFAAVSCPSCGASFDARNVKACPYCNTAYQHEEHDWIMTDLR